tara:strand:- start:19058 stop:19783 length:726 start_codon:yes stop_codon:yes gene_type:complete
MHILKIKNFLLFASLIIFMPLNVLADNLKLKSFGHSSFLIQGGGHKVLINPFKPIGCASGLEEITNVKFDYILASSRLADEGFNPNNALIFVEAGTYKVKDNILNGITIPHDRSDGRRFGMATVWIWNQNNLKIVHMGGAAGKIDINDQILLSRPDLLFISIGGGPKSYNGKEAAEIVKVLRPKIIVPVHFLRDENKVNNCKFADESLFLKSVSGYQVKNIKKTLDINPRKLNENIIYIFK